MQSYPIIRARIRASAAADAVRRFVRETDASMTVEAVLVLPFYLQFYVSAFAFFDAFRTASVNEKAAYTISDVITRRNAGAPVSTAYINWLNDMFDYLLEGRADTWIRVTSVTYSDADTQYEVEWSVGTRGQPPLQTSDLAGMTSRLPIMPGGDTVIVVETETRFGLGYTAAPGYLFSALGDQRLTTFIFTRPRFTPRIEFSS